MPQGTLANFVIHRGGRGDSGEVALWLERLASILATPHQLCDSQGGKHLLDGE